MAKKEKLKPIKVKIVCKTPKGKAKATAKQFKWMFSKIKKPIKEKVQNSTTVYFIYEYKNQREVDKVINKTVPKIEFTIRTFYNTIIHLCDRANKLSKKGAWKLEKARRWILNRLAKKGYDKKQYEDMIDGIDLEDKDIMIAFLAQDLITVEMLEK